MRFALPTSFLSAVVVVALANSPALAKSSSDITQFGHDIRIEADQKTGEVTCFACSVYLRGEYGIRDQYLGVPVKLGKAGLEQVIEIKLAPEEQAALMKSAAKLLATLP